MSAPPTDPDGTPVDRPWFEEALRSQGFVVEPPPEDLEPGSDTGPEPGPATSESDASPDAVQAERPPVPSALLARIAARSQPTPAVENGSTAAPTPEAVVEAEPGPVAEAEPEPVTAEPTAEPGPVVEPERSAPWASAVPAPVAPWASAAPPETSDAEPGPSVIEDTHVADGTTELVEPVVAAEPASEPVTEAEPEPLVAAPQPVIAAPDVGTEAPGNEDARPLAPPPEVAPLGAPWVASADAAPEPAPEPPAPAASLVLDSPYAPAAAVAAGAPPAGPVTPPVALAPEAAEGELWALVGASEPTARPAPASEATRVILTILTAFLIIVIVIGALVLLSQIA